MASSILNSDDGVISGTSGLKSTGGDDGVLVFQSKGTETARINTDKQIVAAAGTASLPIYSTTGDTNTGIFFPAADTIAFAEGGAEAARFDSGGNFGLGVTPSAWGNGQAIQIGPGRGGSLFVEQNLFGYTSLNSNAYYNAAGSWRYQASNSATSYQQLDGVHYWYNAPSGTADNAISFTQAMTLDASGNLLVGRTVPDSASRLVVSQLASTEFPIATKGSDRGISIDMTGTIGIAAFFTTSTGTVSAGQISVSGSTTSYATSSDYRLKHDIQPMTGALAKVAQLKPVTYKWNADDSDGEGFIAHELAEVAPYAVTGEKDGEQMQGVDYGKITPLLTAALQEAIAEIQSLKARVAELEAK